MAEMREKAGSQTQDDLQWGAGYLNADGSVSIAGKTTNGPSLVLSFNTSYGDDLKEFQKVVGVSRVTGPHPPRGNQRRETYKLAITKSADIALVENLLAPRMRGSKQHMFSHMREKLAELRRQKGLFSPFVIRSVSDEELAWAIATAEEQDGLS